MTSNVMDVEECLAKLSLSQKVTLLGGKNFMHLAEIPEVGIEPCRCSDGPNGVRGEWVFNSLGSSVFPCAPGLASTFDVELIQEIATAIGKECRAKGVHVHLGPTVNMIRSPLGGRGFECYSEDPVLSGAMASAFINGIQGQGVASCVKHYVANDQEFERWSIDAIVPERALREIYLEPFRLLLKHSRPQSIMTAYNSVNGCHVSEHLPLVKHILRDEWGFNGCVVSDWTGVYSTLGSLRAGVDVEMPGPPVMRGKQTLRLVHAGKLKVSEIDERARKVLGLIAFAQASGIPFNQPGQILDNPIVRTLLRRAAGETIVLLKNDASLLPLTASNLKSIAVIGTNARDLVYSGGGSAGLATTFKVSPLQAIQERFKGTGVEVKWAQGDSPYKYMPLIDGFLEKAKTGEGVADVEFWNPGLKVENWWDVASDLPPASWQCTSLSMNEFVIDHIPREVVGSNPMIKLSAVFVPDVSGDWEFGLTSVAGSRLYLNGSLLIDNDTNYVRGTHFVGLGSQEIRATVPALVAGRAYDLEVRVWNNPSSTTSASAPEIPGGYRVGARVVKEEEGMVAEAVVLAKASDVAIVAVGTNSDWEAEGADRLSLSLPPTCDTLVEAILKANPNTIIITQSGSPVAMPWVNDASTLLHAFLGGNAAGYGITDVLFGDINPSAKLAVTFPARLEDNPSAHSFGEQSTTPGKVMYDEGIYIGYRHYDKHNITPLFPFGHGLSYTTFTHDSLLVTPHPTAGEFSITLTVRNTGPLAGRESIQFYVSKTSLVDRPVKELGGFGKTAMLQPGEMGEVRCELEKEAFSFWDCGTGGWCAEKGVYEVLAGGLRVEVRLEESIVWKGLE